jgi:hypothetical protein
MAKLTDKVADKTKEAIAEVTGDEKLKNEGEKDWRSGCVSRLASARSHNSLALPLRSTGAGVSPCRPGISCRTGRKPD